MNSFINVNLVNKNEIDLKYKLSELIQKYEQKNLTPSTVDFLLSDIKYYLDGLEHKGHMSKEMIEQFFDFLLDILVIDNKPIRQFFIY